MQPSSKLYGASFVLGKAGFSVTGGAANTVAIANTFGFAVNGKAFSKASAAGITTPTTDAVTGVAFTTLTANQGCILAFCVDTSGTVKAVQGPVLAMSGGSFVTPPGAPQFPDIPDTLAMFAYMVAKTDGTAGTITLGTSNWNATGFTQAVQDVICMPRTPQVS